ncbi:MAG: class I SAM-dependent methyltransferase [Planctomycetota bacterium]|nr:MAG: class I SAM-dependent methyltransferase [Planctomycetota bacterium]
MASGREDQRLRQAYDQPQVAQHYAQTRWQKGVQARRTHRKEWAIVQSFLKRIGPLQRVLDIPCGAGRFQPLLAAGTSRLAGGDLSAAMLHQAAGSGFDFLFQGSAQAVPVADGAVDLVFSFRLYHHFPESPSRLGMLQEFARCSRRWAILSYFEDRNLQAWRHRLLGRKRARFPISRRQFESECKQSGWQVARRRFVARGISEQVVVLLEKAGSPNSKTDGLELPVSG